ncbi:MAG: PhoU domain-containing protein [Thermoproteota archaeon]
MLAKNESIENKYVISSVLIVRYLERIADHASYACESIIYVATGKNAKVNIC